LARDAHVVQPWLGLRVADPADHLPALVVPGDVRALPRPTGEADVVKKRRRIRAAVPPPPWPVDLLTELKALRADEGKRLSKATYEFDKVDGAVQAALRRQAAKGSL